MGKKMQLMMGRFIGVILTVLIMLGFLLAGIILYYSFSESVKMENFKKIEKHLIFLR